MPRFVLEIGTEEIPPRFFPPALAQLRQDGARMLEGARLAFHDIKVYGTPRRLVLIAEGLAAQQAARTREERGPAAKVAFDSDGNPTKAAQGFARRHGLTPEQLVRKETDQGEYVFAVIQDPELPAKEALSGPLPGLISGLSFPKTMRWGTGKLRFGRPIRWLLALVDEDIVDFDLEGLRSGRETRGHPVLADGMKPVQSADEYEKTLLDLSVIVDPDVRWEDLYRQLGEIAAETQATVLGKERLLHDTPIADLVQKPDLFSMVMDDSLNMQTVFLVEYPTAAVGKFSESFLELPDEVLTTEMQHVQSYFPMALETSDESHPWELIPSFVAVRDGGSEHLDTIVAGWESVLRAKLIDVSFFHEQDLKRPLADRTDDLKGVVFQEQLGSMYDKVERVRAVAAAAAGQVGLSVGETKALNRAALLCKADLTTEVVVELSALQGIMGGVYAETGGEEPEVARAIAEHYRPRFAKDDTPWSLLGTLLGLADKLDTVSACFAIGLVPTGSADPYGLRREGMGIVRILSETPDDPSRLPIPLSELSTRRLIRVALDMLPKGLTLQRSADEVAEAVMSFLQERLATRLREQEVRYDLVNAALAIDTDIRDSASRARNLNWLAQKSPDFLKTVIACTRAINISKGFGDDEVNLNLLEPGAEEALWNAYENARREIEKLEDVLRQSRAKYDEARFYESVFGLLGPLRDPIDRYFDDVLVMAEKEDVRRNRLATCWAISQLCRRIADFSLIVQA